MENRQKMNTSDFDYNLPPELIAQEPPASREDARMLVVHRDTLSREHRRVTDLPEYLRAGDLLVLNDTRVIPARIFGKKESGGRVEFLLLEETAENVWDVLMRCSRRPKPGARVVLESGRASAEILEEGEMGRAKIRIHCDGPFLKILEEDGHVPLPPYITRPDSPAKDRNRYQTVYARNPGAVAAPTAGLHFTEPLFQALEEKGVGRVHLTLHVGIGTFRPVASDRVEDHVMDEERYEISPAAAEKINAARRNGGRIVAVGSTSVRRLEHCADADGAVRPGSGRSGLFIYPPYKFKTVDAMLTNFHLPRSTLLMMVCALAGRDFMMQVYEEAVKERYRFFSYGDCMLIL